MNYLIYGLKKSGEASVEFLKDKENTLYLYDNDESVRTNAKTKYFDYNNIKILSEIDDVTLQFVDKLIVSPSISKYNNILGRATAMGIEIMSELELGARAFKGKLIAITGTNGKTTTVELLYHILKVAGKNVQKVGNIGVPITEKLEGHTKKSIFVCEVSSFQLENISTFHPFISCILNVTEDHLNRYDNFDDYKSTKYKIFSNQTKRDYAVMPSNLEYFGKAKRVYFGVESNYSCFIKNGFVVYRKMFRTEKICPVSALTLKGKHNLKNVLCAVAISKILKVKNKFISHALKTFIAPHHRCEKIKEINGISFYDDSKATNIDATIKACDNFRDKEKFILILGGSDKNFSYLDIFRHLPKNLKKIIAMGEVKDKIESAKKELNVDIPLEKTDTLREAVILSCQDLKQGEALLLSPASASFNEFKNYIERGKCFKKYVEEYYEKKR